MIRPPRPPWLLPTPLLAAFGLLAASSAAVCASAEPAVRVGVYENPPKVYTDARGDPAGLFIELIEAVARAQDWRLEYQACDWQVCLDRLAAGALDLMPDVAFTAERAARFRFSDLSVASSWSQVYSAPDLRVHQLADLDGRRVALLSGGVQQAFFDRLMRSSGFSYQEIAVDSLADGYAAVAAGDADAVVTNSFYAARNAQRYRLRETPILFLPVNLYFAAPKDGAPDVLAMIDKHLLMWRQDPDSIYFRALRRAMGPAPEIRTPLWVGRALAMLGAALLLAVGLAFLLRWQINRRTADLLATTRELAAQRAAFEQLASARGGELRALFDAANVGIVLIEQRIIQRGNRYLDELFGYAPGEQIGQSTRIWYLDDADFRRYGEAIYGALARGATDTRELQLMRKDGEPFWARLSTRAVDPDDYTKGAVCILQDISAERALLGEMERAKTLAEDAARAKSEFLANMSHEIRTPMNAILGMQYLALQQDLPAGVRYHLEKAQGAAHALLGLLNDILDFSKIEAGKIALEEVEFGLDTVLERLTDAVGYQAEHKGIEFLIRYDAAIPPMLIGDPLRLGQVLLNLCGNAVKFTEAGEVELAFRALRMDDRRIDIQVCVRDSGIGMTPEIQANLFDQFEQGDPSTTRRFGGSGLGLAISKRLVELMHGRLWVEDSQPGRGSTLCFTARLQPAGDSLKRRRALIDHAVPYLSGTRVLVVDDNAAAREILLEILAQIPVAADAACSGTEALRSAREADPPYDLVLMDWRMPGMNGDEAAQRIQCELPSARRPKVVMITAYGRQDVIRLAERAGVDGFLIKPVSPSTLLDTLLSVFGHQRLAQELGAGAGARPRSERPVAATGLAGARVLLVEDNEINREFAGELLRSQGLLVDEAENGAAALERLGNGPYDVVLMDLQMPVMDGLEATVRLRARAEREGERRLAELPVIAMTALAMNQDVERAIAAGMNDHVAKPVVPDHLFEVLARWVRIPAEGRAALGAAAERTSELPLDLASLQSLDTTAGLRRIGGRTAAYRRQLHRFRERYADAADELSRLCGSADPDGAARFCHALKGVLGTLGANALFEAVAAIELELAAGRRPAAQTLESVRRRLRELFEEIGRVAHPGADAAADPLAPSSNPTRISALSAVEIQSLLERLEHGLRSDLGAVEPLLERLRSATWSTPLSGSVTAMTEALEVFDIDDAQAQIEALREKLRSSA